MVESKIQLDKFKEAPHEFEYHGGEQRISERLFKFLKVKDKMSAMGGVSPVCSRVRFSGASVRQRWKVATCRA